MEEYGMEYEETPVYVCSYCGELFTEPKSVMCENEHIPSVLEEIEVCPCCGGDDFTEEENDHSNW